MAMDSDVVRALHAAGTSHGRPPEPVPEADPWEEADPLEAASPVVVVVFPGTPSLRVSLHGDGEDAVQLDTYVTFDVPRAHTVAVVTALLSKDGAYTREARGVLGAISRRVGLEFVEELAVEVPGATYSQAVPWLPISSLHGWLGSLPRRP